MTTEELAAKKAAEEAAAQSIANMSTAGGRSAEEIEAARVAAAATNGKSAEELAAEKAAAEAAAAAGDKFTPNSYWGVYKEKFNVDMPDALNVENLPEEISESELMFHAIQQNTLNALPAPVRELYKYLSENESVEEFYKAKAGQSSYLDLPDEQFAIEHLKRVHGKSEANPNGLSEEAISEKVTKLAETGALDIMVLDWKAAERKSIDESKSDVNIEAVENARFDKVVSGAKSNLQSFYDKPLKEVKSVNGLDVTQEQLDAFKPLFEKIVMPDKALGTSPLMMMIQDNGVLYNMLFGLFNSKDAIANVISNAKEEAKDSLLKVLDIEPISTQERTPETDLSVKLSKFASAEK